eukprot:12583390-Alexandrium_andersonii.AAC.1
MDANARLGTFDLPGVCGGNWKYAPNQRGAQLAVQLGALGGSFLNAFGEGEEGSIVAFVPNNPSQPMPHMDYSVAPSSCRCSSASVLADIDCD